MKKASVVIYAVAGLLAGVLLTLFTLYTLIPAVTHEKGREAADAAPVSNAALTEAALDTAAYLKNNDFEALAETVHPDYGVVFSPIATVNLASNLSFTARQVESFGSGTDKLIWGVRPDSGEPISMTVGEYFTRYVTNRDYTCAPVVTVNYTLRDEFLRVTTAQSTKMDKITDMLSAIHADVARLNGKMGGSNHDQ